MSYRLVLRQIEPEKTLYLAIPLDTYDELFQSDFVELAIREYQLIFDEIRDHYLWLDVGWDDYKRIYYCIIHFDIKDGKIWLQQNATDLNPAEDLIEMGVAREDIVLGLQPPFKRPYTNYGVA